VHTFVVREIVLHRAHGKLLSEPINLVQEQDDARLNKPSRVANGIKQCQGFLHTVDSFVLEQQLIIFGYGDQEQDGSDILKAMDPLLPFGALSTNVKHAVCEVANDEGSFRDTGSFDTGTKHILVSGKIVRLGDAVNSVKVAIQHQSP
jgi:hypothetical protein